MKRILMGLAVLAMAWPGISGAQEAARKAGAQEAAQKAGAQEAAQKAGAQEATQKPGDKLGVGDALHVTVFQQPDLTTDARISEKGTLNVPLIGEVKLAGMTQAEAGTRSIRETMRTPWRIRKASRPAVQSALPLPALASRNIRNMPTRIPCFCASLTARRTCSTLTPRCIASRRSFRRSSHRSVPRS